MDYYDSIFIEIKAKFPEFMFDKNEGSLIMVFSMFADFINEKINKKDATTVTKGINYLNYLGEKDEEILSAPLDEFGYTLKNLSQENYQYILQQLNSGATILVKQQER